MAAPSKSDIERTICRHFACFDVVREAVSGKPSARDSRATITVVTTQVPT
jgi:hypothetical protein